MKHILYEIEDPGQYAHNYHKSFILQFSFFCRKIDHNSLSAKNWKLIHNVLYITQCSRHIYKNSVNNVFTIRRIVEKN